MYKGKKILAIIPARGGSKGLPGKNIRQICGKPLMMWPFQAARKSEYVDEIIISTEDSDIAKLAVSNEAIIPFLRPMSLASDTSPSSDAIVFTIEEFKRRGQVFDYILLLEPTSPLTDNEDIDAAIRLLIDNKDGAKSVVGIGKVESCHPNFVVEKRNGFITSYVQNADSVTRRQDLLDLFYFDGSFYFSDIEYYLEKRTFYHQYTLGLEMPKFKNFEIDDIIDFYVVERLLELKQKGEL